jgi:hypothetical protein
MSSPCSSTAIYLISNTVLNTDMRQILIDLKQHLFWGIAWVCDYVLTYSIGYNLICVLKIVGKHVEDADLEELVSALFPCGF